MTGADSFADLAEQMDAAIERREDASVMDLARRMDQAGHGAHWEQTFRELLAFRVVHDRPSTSRTGN